MRRLHVDYGEYLIRLENSGKAVFRSNKTVMARRRFPNLSLCHHLYLLVRHASLTGRSAFLPGREAAIFQMLFSYGERRQTAIPRTNKQDAR